LIAAAQIDTIEPRKLNEAPRARRPSPHVNPEEGSNMRPMFQALLVATLTFALPGLPSAYAQKYKVAKGSEIKAKIHINVKAVGEILARSKRVKGEVEVVSHKDGTYKLKGKLYVKVRKLRSGNRSRDRKMWSALGKARQRRIVFLPQKLTLKGGKGTIKGLFGINTQKKIVTLKVTQAKGKIGGKNKLSFKVAGQLSCKDFKIKRPSLMFVKIEDKVDLLLTLHFAPR